MFSAIHKPQYQCSPIRCRTTGFRRKSDRSQESLHTRTETPPGQFWPHYKNASGATVAAGIDDLRVPFLPRILMSSRGPAYYAISPEIQDNGVFKPPHYPSLFLVQPKYWYPSETDRWTWQRHAPR